MSEKRKTMKTLDEVIDMVQASYDVLLHDGYLEDAGLCPDELEPVLYYLREYRKLDSLDAVAFPEDDNPALTWQELKQMEGKPVWVEADNGQEKFKHWFIIDEFTVSDIPGIQIMWCLYNSFRFWEADLGKTWQAYRKERK